MRIYARWFKRISKLRKKHSQYFLFGSLVIFIFGFFAWNSRGVLIYSETPDPASLPATQAPKPKHLPTPQNVRAIYMSSWVGGTPSIREPLINFVEDSEINSIVLDIKDSTGKISFKVESPMIGEMGSVERRIADIKGLIERLHEKNIYVIGRITVFQDPYMAKKFPNLAVSKKGGGIWRDRKGLTYIDPGAEDFWKYIVEIAKESERMGFDEINFDYIRYPSDGPIQLAVFPYTNGREKPDVLESFFVYLRRELMDLAVPISGDIFGLVIWADDDLNIGQVLERTAPYFDYIAPMVYPSHYESGFQGFKNPAAHPHEVIFTSLDRAKSRLGQIGQDLKKLRPWIQDFDLGADYGPKEILAQKQAIYDAGLDSWMSWDPSNIYTKEAYSVRQN